MNRRIADLWISKLRKWKWTPFITYILFRLFGLPGKVKIAADMLRSDKNMRKMERKGKNKIYYFKKYLAERSFDLRTSGLWAQHASTAPLCYLQGVTANGFWWATARQNMTKTVKNCCQKWDSNPRPQKWTATWTQRLRPLGHPDPYHIELSS